MKNQRVKNQQTKNTNLSLSTTDNNHFNLFPITTHDKKIRRVGIELELAGLAPQVILNTLKDIYGGTIEEVSPFKFYLNNSQLGKFTVELDAKYLQDFGNYISQSEQPNTLKNTSLTIAQKVSETFVPWELITSPLYMTDINKLKPAINALRAKGGLGTKHSLQYAFGVHFNPELPSLNAATLLNYMRAFVCLYDWLEEKEDVDIARKITPFINHYSKEYCQLITDITYQPTMAQLITDYITFNPTRNKALDMLPLFKFIDEGCIDNLDDKALINARPTLHYRLPNCEMDNPNWSLTESWMRWCQVELLANSPKTLAKRCESYLESYLKS